MSMRRLREKSWHPMVRPLTRSLLLRLVILINWPVLSIWYTCRPPSTRSFSSVIASFRKSKRSLDTEDSTKLATKSLITKLQLLKTTWSRRPTSSSTSRSSMSLRISKSSVSQTIKISTLKTSRWPSTTTRSLTKTSKSGKRRRAFLSDWGVKVKN